MIYIIEIQSISTLLIFRTLYDQLCQNRKKEEDELAARRKLMYGVRPMDDDEYKDYEQMEIARRERERQRKEKQDYEERQFSKHICLKSSVESIQQEIMLAEYGQDEEYEIDYFVVYRIGHNICPLVPRSSKPSPVRIRRKEESLF